MSQATTFLVTFWRHNTTIGMPPPQTTSRNDPLRGYKGLLFEGGSHE